MKTFFSSTFIKKEELEEAGISYPIQLEYYKIINEDEMVRQEKAKFGISIVKTEYKETSEINDRGIAFENRFKINELVREVNKLIKESEEK